MNKILIVAMLMICAACSGNSRGEMPKELQLYGNQIMYYYEDPTMDRLRMAIDYRGPALKIMYRECDASAYKHAITADSIFFALVNEKYNYGLYPDVDMDGVQWTSDKLTKHPVGYGGDLDYYWSAFFATGEFKWVDMVITNIANSDSAIAGPARWSCRANYRQHRKIKEYVDSKPELKEVIFADKKPG